MASFRYKALSATGAVVNGTLEAVSERAVIEWLREQGHFPISATEAEAAGWQRWLHADLLPKRGPSTRDLAIATQELATLIHAGLELDRALQILIGLGETRNLAQPLGGALARLKDGASFADALATDPAFPKFYVNMVRAGEMGGNLEATLRRLAEYLARAQAVREAIASALVYPAILLATAGLSIAVILLVVLPQFEPLFQDAGKSLPLATRIVMGLGDVLGATWWILLLAAAAGAVWFRRALERPAFRKQWDILLLRLPLFGDLLIKMETERFSRTLGTLLGNGVTLPVALGITGDTLSNSAIAAAVGETAVGLREGEGLAGRLSRSSFFPPMALDLIRVGEETGRLDEMLLRLADLLENAVKHTIERLLALLVPLLTVFLGMIVAGLIGSMLIAILSVNDLAF
ncbi:type II secretion system F family protein [Parvibaculum sp.]|uniref:type II secretion system F family protein n=1 Tax=Parvibaculum sp. TaxID=2024848 RepID=UPI002C399E13|nr:type II secretion system F family protein [Parvibaculum sp.]HUD52755.1 type II secretion system F family protein [Parvibaculum sp.]